MEICRAHIETKWHDINMILTPPICDEIVKKVLLNDQEENITQSRWDPVWSERSQMHGR